MIRAVTFVTEKDKYYKMNNEYRKNETNVKIDVVSSVAISLFCLLGIEAFQIHFVCPSVSP